MQTTPTPNDELATTPHLQQLRRKPTGFVTPPDYFAQATTRLLQQVATPIVSPAPVRRFPLWRRTWVGVAAAALLLSGSFVAYYALVPTPDVAAATLANVDSETAIQYINLHIDEFDEDLLAVHLSASAEKAPATAEEEAVLETLLDDMDAADLWIE